MSDSDGAAEGLEAIRDQPICRMDGQKRWWHSLIRFPFYLLELLLWINAKMNPSTFMKPCIVGGMAALVLLALCCIAAEPPGSNRPLVLKPVENPKLTVADFTAGEIDRLAYMSTLPLKQVEAAPRWNPERTTLPLGPEQAQKLAVSYAEQQFGDKIEWGSSFSSKEFWVLRTTLVRKSDDMWHYAISLIPMRAGSGASNNVTIFVTMDGKVAPVEFIRK